MKAINDLKEKLAEEIKKFDRARNLTANAARVLWLDFDTSQDWLRLATPWAIENANITRRLTEVFQVPYLLTIKNAVICDKKQEKYKKATVTFLTFEAGEVVVSAYDSDGKVVASVSRNVTGMGVDSSFTMELSVSSGFSAVGVSAPGFFVYNTSLEG